LIFHDEYLVDLNATQAYKKAYSSVRKTETAEAAASRMLRNVKVKAYIDARLEILSEKAQIDQEWVLKRYKRLADYHIQYQVLPCFK